MDYIFRLVPLLSESSGFLSEWLQAWSAGALILVVIGIALLICEMMLPGIGIAGVSGAIALLIGLALGSNSIEGAAFSFAICVVILLIAAFFVFKVVFSNKRKRSRFILDDAIVGESTSLASSEKQTLVGKSGIALTALRPSGTALIDGERMDVVTHAEFIAKDDEIIVAAVEGVKILVKRA